MPLMNAAEREAFLAEPGVLMRVATVDAGGRPHVTPVWFIHEKGRIWFTPRQHSAWLAHVRSNPDVALCIDEQPLPYRKVLVEGRAQIVYDTGRDDEWRDVYRRIARRYVAPDEAEAYIVGTLDQPRALLAVDLSGATVRSWRMPVEDEPGDGIWHARYYAPGSRLAPP